MEKRYDFSFMREYAQIYNVTDEELSKIFYCGTSKVKYVLDGEILLKESLVEDICIDFKCKNYEEFKKQIEDKIASSQVKKMSLKL